MLPSTEENDGNYSGSLCYIDYAFCCNLLLTIQRDVKEDFIVCIIDVSTISSWAFAQIDSIATLVLLATFALLATTYDHLKVLCILLILLL